MAFTYNINAGIKDTRSSVYLFICHNIANIIDVFLSTFLVAYIHQFSGSIFSYIHNVAIYEIATYVFLGAAYILLSPLVDKTNRVWIYRSGLILRGALVVFCIFFGKDLSKLLIVAGALQGISYAFYYSSYNVIAQEMVSRKSIKKYISLNLFANNILTIFVPIILGSLIEVSTYNFVAIYVAVLCAIQIGISFFIKAHRPENSYFSLKDYYKMLKKDPQTFKKMKFIYISGFIYGTYTIIGTLVNICIMWQFSSNFSLGMLTSVFSAISALSIYFFNRFTKPGKRAKIFGILALIGPIATAIFAIHIGIATLIIYNVAIAISTVIFEAVFDLYRNSNLKEDGMYDYIAEHQCLMDTTYNISRTITFVLMLLVGMLKSLAAFKIFLVIMIFSHTAIFIMLTIYEKRFISNPDKQDKEVFKIIMKAVKEK